MIDGQRARARKAQKDRLRDESAPPKGVGAWVAKRGITADTITAVGIFFAAATGFAIGIGALYVAAGLLIVGGLMDTLDGLVAKASGSSSLRGAFFDSVADRISDGFIFGGLAFYFLDGRHPKLALLPIAILVVSATISYERAKAESLGFTARGGLMERAERLIGLGLALVTHIIFIPILITLLTLTCFTAAGRFLRVWRQASGKDQQSQRSDAWKAEIDAKWKTWRSTSASRSTRNRRDVVPLSTRFRGVLASDRATTTRERRTSRERPVRTKRHHSRPSR